MHQVLMKSETTWRYEKTTNQARVKDFKFSLEEAVKNTVNI